MTEDYNYLTLCQHCLKLGELKHFSCKETAEALPHLFKFKGAILCEACLNSDEPQPISITHANNPQNLLQQ